MKKIIISLFVILTLLSGCESDDIYSDNSLVQACIFLDKEVKTITSSVTSGNVHYQYKAIPTKQNAHGAVSDWSDLVVSDNKASIGTFSQGNWTISVRELINDVVLYEGSTNYFITSSQECCIPIFMERVKSSRTGNVLFCISCPCYDDLSYVLSCRYKELSDSVYKVKDDWSCITGQNTNKFTGQLTLNEGSYIFDFTYYQDGIQIGGETVALDVFGDNVQSLCGDILSLHVFDDCILINGSLSTKASQLNQEVVFAYSGDTKERTYSWYVDNVLQTGWTTSVFSFTPKENKDYQIKCVTSDIPTGYTFTLSCGVPTIWVTFDDLVGFVKDTQKICVGFKVKGTANSQMITNYPYQVAASSDYTSLDDLNLEPVLCDNPSDALSYSTLIVGSNFGYVLNTMRSWFNLAKGETNNTVQTIYCYYDPTYQCLLGLNGLKTVYLRSSGTVLTGNAFDGLGALVNIELPDCLVQFKSNVFKDCVSLKEVRIPNSVTTVDRYDFKNCTSLTSVTFKDGSPIPDAWKTKWAGDCPLFPK